MATNIAWVEIPVTNLARAMKFYRAVLGVKVKKTNFPGEKIAILSAGAKLNGGSLCQSKKAKPGKTGPLIYYSVDGRIEAACKAAVKLGGKLLLPPQSAGKYGYRAIILDCEGNRIALHSKK
ncbi:MAG TPA: VOC family protein [Planctomycetota bacterium]|nr:VOC family protein [Planctomycetota bacterium]